MINFILPKFIGVVQYGYWQVYLLYSTYMMLFSLGFNDGLFLKYGHLNYEELDFKKLRITLKIFMVIITIISFFLLLFSFLEEDKDKMFAFLAISLSLSIVGLNNTLLTILQFTNRIGLNNFLYVLNRVMFISSIFFLFMLNHLNFKSVIVSDIVIKIFLLCFTIYKSKELFFGRTNSFEIGFREYLDDIAVGIKLMFANIISSLLLGLGRFIVERELPIEEFSLYSFATTIALFSLTFISVASTSLYPLLKRVPEVKLPIFYQTLNTLLCVVLFFMLAGYYPISYLVQHYFSDYKGILAYLYILFILIVSQGKMQFLVNTYYKVLREEKEMLKANIVGFIIAIIVIVPAFYITNSIFSIVMGTTVTLLWRCYASEFFLKNKLGITSLKNMFAEFTLMLSFIISTIFLPTLIGFFSYVLTVCVYIYLNRKLLVNYYSKIVAMRKYK